MQIEKASVSLMSKMPFTWKFHTHHKALVRVKISVHVRYCECSEYWWEMVKSNMRQMMDNIFIIVVALL